MDESAIKNLIQRYGQLDTQAETLMRETLLRQPDYRASLVLTGDDIYDDDNYPITVSTRKGSEDMLLGVTDIFLDEKGGIRYCGYDLEAFSDVPDLEADPSLYPGLLQFLDTVLPSSDDSHAA